MLIRPEDTAESDGAVPWSDRTAVTTGSRVFGGLATILPEDT